MNRAHYVILMSASLDPLSLRHMHNMPYALNLHGIYITQILLGFHIFKFALMTFIALLSSILVGYSLTTISCAHEENGDPSIQAHHDTGMNRKNVQTRKGQQQKNQDCKVDQYCIRFFTPAIYACNSYSLRACTFARI